MLTRERSRGTFLQETTAKRRYEVGLLDGCGSVVVLRLLSPSSLLSLFAHVVDEEPNGAAEEQ